VKPAARERLRRAAFPAALMTLLLSLHFPAWASTLAAALLMAIAMGVAWPRLARADGGGSGPLFAVPRGVVLVLAVLAGIMFLVEGAMLDWGAILLTEQGLVATAHGGIGYILFSVAMLAGRFSGDAVTARFGDRAVLLWGGACAAAGVFVVLSASAMLGVAGALAGFVLVGAGASNIVPILFRLAGAQQAMPAGLAVAAISTVGYAGVLAGPASIGFVAKTVGLAMSFGMLGILLCLVPASAHLITASRAAR